MAFLRCLNGILAKGILDNYSQQKSPNRINFVLKFRQPFKNILKSKKLYLKLNEKVYSSKTDKKGKAIFKIKLRKKGKFKGIITFKGDATYSSSKKTIYIKIK